jgi:hypothetical protein
MNASSKTEEQQLGQQLKLFIAPSQIPVLVDWNGDGSVGFDVTRIESVTLKKSDDGKKTDVTFSLTGGKTHRAALDGKVTIADIQQRVLNEIKGAYGNL